MSANHAATGGDGMSRTVLMIVKDQDRPRDFYHHVTGARVVRDRDPVILSFHNGVIVLKRRRRPDQRQANSDDGTPD